VLLEIDKLEVHEELVELIEVLGKKNNKFIKEKCLSYT
jgi:hypothetical protein